MTTPTSPQRRRSGLAALLMVLSVLIAPCPAADPPWGALPAPSPGGAHGECFGGPWLKGPIDGPKSHLTPERAADEAVADARHHHPAARDGYLFLGRSRQLPGLVRLELLRRAPGEAGPGKPFAVYEITTIDRRVVRRDFLADRPAARPAAHLATDTPAVATPTVQVQGVLRNLPGYILETPDFLSRFLIWAEANGKVVATQTELLGTTVYRLAGIPVDAGTVTIKAKIRGYDLTTLHPGVAINAAHPVGTIAGIDVDFHQLTPIQRDVRALVQSNGQESTSSFPAGNRARVFIRETGHTVDVVSANGIGEGWLTAVPTGWELSFLAINLDHGSFSGEQGPLVVPENGNTAFTLLIKLE